MKYMLILFICLVELSINPLQASYDRIEGILHQLPAADVAARKQLAYQLVGLTVGRSDSYKRIQTTDALEIVEDRPNPNEKALNLAALAASASILTSSRTYNHVIAFYTSQLKRKDLPKFQRGHITMQRLVFARAHGHFTKEAIDQQLLSSDPFGISAGELDAFLNDAGTLHGKEYIALVALFNDARVAPVSLGHVTASIEGTAAEDDLKAVEARLENARKVYADAGIAFPHELVAIDVSYDGMPIPSSAYHKNILIHSDLENAGVRTVIRNAGLITLSEFPICVYLNRSVALTNMLLEGHFAVPTGKPIKYVPNPHSFGLVLLNLFFADVVPNEFIGAQVHLIEQNLQTFFPMLPIERRIPGALITILASADPLGKFLNSLGFVRIQVTEGSLFDDGVDRVVLLKFTRRPNPLPAAPAAAAAST